MKLNIFILLVWAYLPACQQDSKQYIEPVLTKEFVTYIIDKGAQFSRPNLFDTMSVSQLDFIALFDSSCIYSTTRPSNQHDINKLYGFSDCDSHHLNNSVRIGWRWSDSALRLFGYVHYDGGILSKEIAPARIGTPISCSIRCAGNTYQFRVNEDTASLPRYCAGDYIRYKLYPYFGGDETAPHTIKIDIKEL
ncbi:MAG TPA: hypothetical protein VLC98_17045 [Phnomibacter sp.]|nr:hypothetical protein [Phnomibacter sp.]